MAIELPALPYAENALEPHYSARTISFHHGKHHAAYVTNLNKLVAGTDLESKSLEEIIRAVAGDSGKAGVFNNAAQIYNHTFYWHSLSPKGGGEPTGTVAEAIKQSFGSFGDFKEKFSAAAAGQFGSGWAWLVKEGPGRLAIVAAGNAGCPLTESKPPILTCDVWEHAYYIDYRNARAKYVEAWFNLVNWEFAAKNLG